jgi:hypothetical protein
MDMAYSAKQEMEQITFWQEFLTGRAQELGLPGTVRPVQSAEVVNVMTWVYEADGGLVDLGWSVEMAESALRGMAGA